MPPGTLPMPASIGRLQRLGLVTGGVFVLALLLGYVFDREQFFRSYLLGWLFWLGVAVGCLGLAMLNQLTGGLWGVVPRRLHEAAPWLSSSSPSISAWARSSSGPGPRWSRPTPSSGARRRI